MTTIRIILRGRVQGVFFRRFAVDRAKELGIHGSVRNLSDGRSVEVIAQGPEDTVREFTARVKKGPPNAVVESAEIEPIENSPLYKGFAVK